MIDDMKMMVAASPRTDAYHTRTSRSSEEIQSSSYRTFLCALKYEIESACSVDSQMIVSTAHHRHPIDWIILTKYHPTIIWRRENSDEWGFCARRGQSDIRPSSFSHFPLQNCGLDHAGCDWFLETQGSRQGL